MLLGAVVFVADLVAGVSADEAGRPYCRCFVSNVNLEDQKDAFLPRSDPLFVDEEVGHFSD